MLCLEKPSSIFSSLTIFWRNQILQNLKFFRNKSPCFFKYFEFSGKTVGYAINWKMFRFQQILNFKPHRFPGKILFQFPRAARQARKSYIGPCERVGGKRRRAWLTTYFQRLTIFIWLYLRLLSVIFRNPAAKLWILDNKVGLNSLKCWKEGKDQPEHRDEMTWKMNANIRPLAMKLWPNSLTSMVLFKEWRMICGFFYTYSIIPWHLRIFRGQ